MSMEKISSAITKEERVLEGSMECEEVDITRNGTLDKGGALPGWIKRPPLRASYQTRIYYVFSVSMYLSTIYRK